MNKKWNGPGVFVHLLNGRMFNFVCTHRELIRMMNMEKSTPRLTNNQCEIRKFVWVIDDLIEILVMIQQAYTAIKVKKIFSL